MRHAMIAVLCAGLVTASTATGQIVQLTAIDSKCISPGGNNWNDNRLRAYWSGDWVDGFVKFDFSSIPDGSQIISMSLRTFHEEGFGNPLNDPQVRLYRVANDSWARNQNNSHPGLNEVLTPVHNGFPFGNLVPWDWPIDVSAVNWSQDLADDRLSICMRNVQTSYSYVYWHGSDPNPAPPVLTVEYSGGGAFLRISGTCPGRVTVSWSGATPSRPMGIVFASSTGNFTIPGGLCGGTQLGLSSNGLQLVYTGNTGSNGSGQVSSNAGTPACRKYLQMVIADGSPCNTTNVVQIP